MNYLIERVSAAERRSEELEQFFYELSRTTGLFLENKEDYTVQQFVELCYYPEGIYGKIRKISADMLDSVDFTDSYILRKKTNTLGNPILTLCREIAHVTNFGSLEKSRQKLYVFLNSAMSVKSVKRKSR